jgi:archaellum component FlaC
MNENDSKIKNLEIKIDNLDKKLDLILELLADIKPNCEQMRTHINFIDSVYENVKHPLNSLCRKFNYLTDSPIHILNN